MSTKTRKIAEREKLFIISVSAYTSIYGEEMIQDFISYWTEMNQNGNKMRFEMEKTWNVERRLARWKKNSYVFNKTKDNKTNEQTERMKQYEAVARTFQSRNTE